MYNAKEAFDRLTKDMDADKVARIKAIMKERNMSVYMAIKAYELENDGYVRIS